MSAITEQARPENLAAVFQEILTAVVRLRHGRQTVTDGQVFRGQVLAALNLADKEARQRGYAPETIRLATFAVVAFIDESVLNQPTATFADWIRKPLQQELFGVHVAGETFFVELKDLLTQPDSDQLVDVLEVYQLCLLLGFRGRYGAAGPGELHAITEAIANKIRRNRGAINDFSPAWQVPANEKIPSQGDPWIQRLLVAFVVCVVLALLLFVGFRYSLRSGLSTLQAAADQLKR